MYFETASIGPGGNMLGDTAASLPGVASYHVAVL